jgi:N-glycosylase/DNA lyase
MDSFNIEQILECGQCFRFQKVRENTYRIIAMRRVLYVEQIDSTIILSPCNEQDFKQLWIRYFDLDLDYNRIKKILSQDSVLDKAIQYASGIRILNQETWECLISFIISQNNNIPRIKQIIETISIKYGDCIEQGFYAFPTVTQLSKASEEDLRQCKVGFRAKYIVSACNLVTSGSLLLNELDDMTTPELRLALMKIKGVGPKVADCVMLFSQRRQEVFPTDVWIKRIMQHFYFEHEASIIEIHQYAYEYFENRAGIAQQYLFYYAMRNNSIFSNKQ